MAQSLLVRAFEKATGTQAQQRTAAAVSRFGPYLVGMIAAKGLSTVGQLLVSRWLGPRELGQLAVVLSTATLLASPLAGAWGATFVRYAAGQEERLWAPLLTWTRGRVLFWSCAVALALFVTAPVLAGFLRVSVSLLIAGALLGLAMALWLFSKAVCQGRESWRRFIAAELAFGFTVAAAAGVLLVTTEASWSQAALVFLAAYLAGAVPGWALFRAASTARTSGAGPEMREIRGAAAEYARFSLLTGGANTILLYSDRLLAQRVLGFSEVGVYQMYNFATIGVALLITTMLYNFVFPLFPQGNRQAFAALFRSGFTRLLPLTLAGLFAAAWAQIYLTGFPLRPGLLVLATLSATASLASGFYGHLVASVGVDGVRLSARAAAASLAAFAIGILPAVKLGGLGGIFALYTAIYVGVAVYYDRSLQRLTVPS